MLVDTFKLMNYSKGQYASILFAFGFLNHDYLQLIFSHYLQRITFVRVSDLKQEFPKDSEKQTMPWAISGTNNISLINHYDSKRAIIITYLLFFLRSFF
jgi:hypothetical protein